MKIFLRALFETIGYVITLPIRILIIIGICIACVVYSIRIGGSFGEYFKPAIEGMRIAAKKEIHWIKTGKIEP